MINDKLDLICGGRRGGRGERKGCLLCGMNWGLGRVVEDGDWDGEGWRGEWGGWVVDGRMGVVMF